MSIIIDTPDGIAFFQMARVLYALKIQRDTGLKHSRGSVLKLAQRDYGVTSRTIAGACEEMEKLVEAAIAKKHGATT